MMNVKFVRVKVTKSEIFLFFFLFSKIFHTSSCLFFPFCAPDKSLPHYLCVYVYRWARDEKKGAVQKKKESILLVGLLNHSDTTAFFRD